jgi:hypothetical protein
MKIRNDFVSNSSSCSFIIENNKNVKQTFKCFKIFENATIPYDVDDEIRIQISATYKNWTKLRDLLHEIDVIDIQCDYARYKNRELLEDFIKSLKETPDEKRRRRIPSNGSPNIGRKGRNPFRRTRFERNRQGLLG